MSLLDECRREAAFCYNNADEIVNGEEQTVLPALLEDLTTAIEPEIRPEMNHDFNPYHGKDGRFSLKVGGGGAVLMSKATKGDTSTDKTAYKGRVFDENSRAAQKWYERRDKAVAEMEGRGIHISEHTKEAIAPEILFYANKQMKKMEAKYPVLAQDNPPPIREITTTARRDAHGFYRYDGTIALNERTFHSTPDAYTTKAQESKEGFKVAGGDELSTFRHEYGHYVDHKMSQATGNPNYRDDLFSRVDAQYQKKHPEYKGTKADVKKFVSEYGASNKGEQFAEAFSEGFSSTVFPREYALTFSDTLAKDMKAARKKGGKK